MMTAQELNVEKKDQQVSPTVSKISMLISATFMGCVGLFVTALAGYPIYTIVFFRGVFGTFFLTLFMIKSHSFSKEFLKETFKLHWKPLLIIGIINPLGILFYFINITISGYAIAAFLLYTNGLFVILFLAITKEEKVSRVNIISFFLAIAGVAIIMEFWTGEGVTYGIIFGLLSGLSIGLLVFCKKVIYNKRNKVTNELSKNGDFDIFLAWWPMLFAALLFLPFGVFEFINLTLIDLIFCLLLGLIPTALAFFLYNVGVKNDKGGNIVILSYIEPIVAIIISFIFLGIISIYTVLGGILIMSANLIILKYSK